jgi:hypothetical protein
MPAARRASDEGMNPTGANKHEQRSKRAHGDRPGRRAQKPFKDGTIPDDGRTKDRNLPLRFRSPIGCGSTADAVRARGGDSVTRRHGYGSGRNGRNGRDRDGPCGRAAARRPIADSGSLVTGTACGRNDRAHEGHDRQLSFEHAVNPPPEQRGGRSVPPTPRPRVRPLRRQRIAPWRTAPPMFRVKRPVRR